MLAEHGPPVDEGAAVPAQRSAPEDETRDPAGVEFARTAPTQAEPTRTRRRRRRRRTSVLDKILLGTGMLLALLAVVGAVGVHVVTNRVFDDVQRIPDVFGALDPDIRPEKPAGAEKTLNFLLVGIDTRAGQQTTGTEGTGNIFEPGRQHADVIMLVHLAADRHSASIVSIPRDSWVAVPNRGMNKINAAYSLGGGTLLVQTVEQLTKLRMDHFAVVDFAGFKDITDAVGGVDIRVAASTGDNRAAPTRLGGDATLAYLRQRYNVSDGDLDQVRRQQAVMKALMTKVSSRGLLASPAGTLKIADSTAKAVSVDDSLGNGDLRSLMFSLRNLRAGAVTFLTAPVRGLGRQGKESVVLLDAGASGQLWKAINTDDVATYVKSRKNNT
jgi:LCP family protein required for cell wall assembly